MLWQHFQRVAHSFIHSENNYSNLFLLKVVLQTTQSWGVLNFSDTAFEFFFAHLSKFYNLVVRLFDLCKACKAFKLKDLKEVVPLWFHWLTVKFIFYAAHHCKIWVLYCILEPHVVGFFFRKESSLSPNYAPCKDLALLQPILCDFLFSSALQHLYSSCIRMPAATAI